MACLRPQLWLPAFTLYSEPAESPRRQVQLISRKEILQQLESLRSRGRGLFTLFGIAFVLIGIPFAIYDVRLVQFARAHSSAKTVLLLGFGLFAVWLITALAFVMAIKHVIARHAPVCPQCAKRITWRERETLLASGTCPHCDFRLFRV